MAPKSKTESKKADAAPPSRRSGRLAGQDASKEKEEVGSKRAAADDKPALSSKKAKSTPASKGAKSKVTSKKASASAKTDAIPESSEEVDVEAADKAEAEADEAADKKELASKKEKEAEAPQGADPETDGKKVMKLGDKLPKVTLKDEEGEDVEVTGLAGERGAVLFLYPKANTPGCTNQACGFRDAFDEIAELGYDVYGLSRDGPTAQKNWKVKQKLTYKLLCDPESKLIKRLGAFVLPKNTKRSHFIFEKGTGKLVEAKYGVKPADDPGNCLNFIKAHQK
ncbi:AhpC-TSA-domain-containing protein [Dioszegia hungarica]|uniref:thioredoxin-dependent peroxiredoxin n=1 Tax=Dioszegia hungarica TaxID=4972 RepID=A0AA38HEC7_9TREE|nr:AhpC-TSA-domain-containing protein [Dioszegia hungarica]KAI9639093.1 AhpC-TSA-domain-containing protein [Dioszegia hungarica]